jgi:hypothetical protein
MWPGGTLTLRTISTGGSAGGMLVLAVLSMTLDVVLIIDYPSRVHVVILEQASKDENAAKCIKWLID